MTANWNEGVDRVTELTSRELGEELSDAARLEERPEAMEAAPAWGFGLKVVI